MCCEFSDFLNSMSGLYCEVSKERFRDELGARSWTRTCPRSIVYERMGPMCISYRGEKFRPTLHCFEIALFHANRRDYLREWARVFARDRIPDMTDREGPLYELHSFFADFPGLQKFIGTKLMLYYEHMSAAVGSGIPFRQRHWSLGSLCTVGRGYMRSRQIEDTCENLIRPRVRSSEWQYFENSSWWPYEGELNIVDISELPVDEEESMRAVQDLSVLVSRLFQEWHLNAIKLVMQFLCQRPPAPPPDY